MSRARPRLYLDVDGVICPFGRPDPVWGPAKRRDVVVEYDDGRAETYEIRWAPALVDAIDSLRERFDLELVWLTTWCDSEIVRRFLVPELGGLAGGRILPFDPAAREFGVPSGWWKQAALIADQATNPAPFIWADDAEVESYGWRVLNATRPTNSLLVAPHPLAGFRPETIAAMEDWLKQLP